MGKKNSPFDKIKTHLNKRGADRPVPAGAEADLEVLVRRCDEVRSLRAEFGSVELSPYMMSLLKVSTRVASEEKTIRAAAAASV